MTDIGEMTVDEALMHYGVLGMKWGKTRMKASPAQIRAARGRVQRSGLQVEKAQLKADMARRGTSERTKLQKEAMKLKAEHLNNPDRVMAARMTRGEKLLTVALFGPAAPISLAAIAGTSAHSRRIERKQEKGKYKKS